MDKQKQLPPESVRTLKYIERALAGLIAGAEAHLGMTLSPEARARALDLGLQFETTEAVHKLRTMNLYCPN